MWQYVVLCIPYCIEIVNVIKSQTHINIVITRKSHEQILITAIITTLCCSALLINNYNIIIR